MAPVGPVRDCEVISRAIQFSDQPVEVGKRSRRYVLVRGCGWGWTAVAAQLRLQMAPILQRQDRQQGSPAGGPSRNSGLEWPGLSPTQGLKHLSTCFSALKMEVVFNVKGWLFAALVLVVAAFGCSKPTDQSLSAPSGSAAVDVPDESAIPDSARLFPTFDWSMGNDFDDGTNETTEWWIRDANRVVSANNNGVYAIWHMSKQGIFRLDPFGGAEAPFLRFLPAKLEDGLGWQQMSNGAPVKFWLRQTDRCGDDNNAEQAKGTPCWELVILNRGRVQRLFFQQGLGVVAASLLNLANTEDSYHKHAWRFPPNNQDPVARPEWLAEADKKPKFTADAVPPIQPLTVAQFKEELAATIKAGTTSIQLDGPRPFYLGAALNRPLTGPVLLISDATAEGWKRWNNAFSPCTFTVQRQPVPFLAEVCGTPTDSTESAQPVMSVRARRQAEDGSPIFLWWPQRPAQTERKEGMRITVGANGDVTILRAIGDPFRHIETTVYRLDQGFSAKSRTVTLAADSQYPRQPENVLLAALFARWNDLNDEIPTFFVTGDEANRLVRTDLKGITGLNPRDVILGTLQPVPAPAPHEAAVKVVTAPLVEGKPIGFLFHSSGCCDSFTNVWGTVQFVRDPQGQWKIQRLNLEFAQKPEWLRSLQPH